jgi:hypothetical protein
VPRRLAFLAVPFLSLLLGSPAYGCSSPRECQPDGLSISEGWKLAIGIGGGVLLLLALAGTLLLPRTSKAQRVSAFALITGFVLAVGLGIYLDPRSA